MKGGGGEGRMGRKNHKKSTCVPFSASVLQRYAFYGCRASDHQKTGKLANQCNFIEVRYKTAKTLLKLIILGCEEYAEV